MLNRVLLVNIWLLIFKLNQSTIGIFIASLFFIRMLLVRRIWILLSLTFLWRRWTYKYLNGYVLCASIWNELLILPDLVANLGGHILQVRWKRAARSISILAELPISSLLRIILLTHLLGFRRARGWMLKNHICCSTSRLTIWIITVKLLSTTISLKVLLTIRTRTPWAVIIVLLLLMMLIIYLKLFTRRITTVQATISLRLLLLLLLMLNLLCL